MLDPTDESILQYAVDIRNKQSTTVYTTEDADVCPDVIDPWTKRPDTNKFGWYVRFDDGKVMFVPRGFTTITDTKTSGA